MKEKLLTMLATMLASRFLKKAVPFIEGFATEWSAAVKKSWTRLKNAIDDIEDSKGE